MTQCRCDPEVVSVHLFTLATMAVCFATDFKHNKKLSYCWETVRRENMPSIAEMDVEMTT